MPSGIAKLSISLQVLRRRFAAMKRAPEEASAEVKKAMEEARQRDAEKIARNSKPVVDPDPDRRKGTWQSEEPEREAKGNLSEADDTEAEEPEARRHLRRFTAEATASIVAAQKESTSLVGAATDAMQEDVGRFVRHGYVVTEKLATLLDKIGETQTVYGASGDDFLKTLFALKAQLDEGSLDAILNYKVETKLQAVLESISRWLQPGDLERLDLQTLRSLKSVSATQNSKSRGRSFRSRTSRGVNP